MLCDQQGRPLRFILTPGQKVDGKAAADLLRSQRSAGGIADEGYDTNAIRSLIPFQGQPQKAYLTRPSDADVVDALAGDGKRSAISVSTGLSKNMGSKFHSRCAM